MNIKPDLTELKAFAAIAAQRSFRKAADELALSPSTLSHMMRTLEQNMGVRLLNRTTRSVAPTEAGARLLASLGPILRDLDLALEQVNAFRERPGGLLRINASEIAARQLLASVVPTFLARYPEMALDLVTDGRLVDIVAEGFDAGEVLQPLSARIQEGLIDTEMVRAAVHAGHRARKLGPPHEWAMTTG